MKNFTRFLVFGFVVNFLVLWLAGSYLSNPTNHQINMPNIGFESMEYNGTHGSVLKAENSHKCALLLHGVRSDRTSMIERAKFLKSIGLTSLLIDMQAHGETKGRVISFGYFEANDAENGMQFLTNKLGCEKVIIIGHSLGGAAAVLGGAASKANALVLESVYPTIEEAVEDRLEARLGLLGRVMAPLLYLQIPLRIGVPIENLRPIKSLKKITVPVLIIGGSLDLSTKVSETIRMYNNVQSQKQLWVVEGAAHEDIYAYSKEKYEATISEFIKKSL